MTQRQKAAMTVAEFLGAGVLTLLILSVQRSAIGVPFFVASAAGLTLAMMAYAVSGSQSGYFNPAVTIGLWSARKLTTIAAAINVVAQLLGAWAAYAVYTYFVNSSLQQVGGHYTGRVLAAEAIGTGIFSFGLAAAVYQGLSRAATAAYAGLSLMLGMIAASTASIGLLNPAVAEGIRAWNIWGSMGWGTYVLGPVIGAIVGVNLYAMLFADQPAKKASVSVVAVPAKKKPAAKRKARK